MNDMEVLLAPRFRFTYRIEMIKKIEKEGRTGVRITHSARGYLGRSTVGKKTRTFGRKEGI